MIESRIVHRIHPVEQGPRMNHRTVLKVDQGIDLVDRLIEAPLVAVGPHDVGGMVMVGGHQS
jgi:hypothetical protein